MKSSAADVRLRRADALLSSRHPHRALKPLAACLRTATAPLSPALAGRLDQLWTRTLPRKLGGRFRQLAAAAFPSDSRPVYRLAELYLPACKDPDLLRRLVRCLPDTLSPLPDEFHAAALSLAVSGSHGQAVPLFRAAALLEEGLAIVDLSPFRICWAAALYASDQYAAAAQVYASFRTHQPPFSLPDCYAALSPVLPAEWMISQEKYDPAREILVQLAQLPNFAGRPSLARALDGCEQYREAAQQWLCCSEGVSLPRQLFFLQRAGEALHRAKAWDEAVACFEKIRTLAPEYPVQLADAWVTEGLCRHDQEHLGEALSCFRAALDALPLRDFAHQVRPLRCCAETSYSLRQPEQGDACFAKARDCALGEADLSTAAQIESDWGDHLREYCRDYAGARQHYTEAIRLFRKLPETDNDVRESLAMAFNGRSICAYHEQNYKGQIADSTAAISLLRQTPSSPAVLLRLSACLRNRGDSLDRLEKYDTACQDYQEAANVYRQAFSGLDAPDHSAELAELLLCCGRMCDRTDDYDRSAEYYSQVLTLLQKTPGTTEVDRTVEYLALAYLRRGFARMRNRTRSFTDALRDFTRAIDLTRNGTHPNMLRILTSSWRQCGELYAAMEQYPLSVAAVARADEAEARLNTALQRT